MNLHVEIKPDFKGTISITDYTEEFGEYISEDVEFVLPRYYHFKYSDTTTINVLRYISSNDEELINVVYSKHDTESDSVRLPLSKDGHYIVDHIVLPTYEWYEKVKNEDLSEYRTVYFTANNSVYKVSNGVIEETDIAELIQINPRRTTISCEHFDVFSIDRLKHCFASAARDIMSNYTKNCQSASLSTFDRDFLWMTINVIKYYLEWGQYSEAQLVLEDLTCHDFCPNEGMFKPRNSSCGCRKSK